MKREEHITPRQADIIRAIVSEYVLTGEPVGSHVLVDKFGFQISPATMRKEMSILEQMGYLKSPHTSAGRIPSDAAFEFYIHELVSLYEVTLSHKAQLEEFYRSAIMQLDQLLKSIAQMLAMTSRQMGVVFAPTPSGSVIKRVEVVSVLDNLVLVIMVSQSGSVYQKKIKLDRPVSQEELYKVSRFLSQVFMGYELSEFQEKGLDFLAEAERYLGDLSEVAKHIAFSLVYSPFDQAIYVEGENQLYPKILEASEDPSEAEFLICKLSDRNYLKELFNQGYGKDPLMVRLGLDIEGHHFAGYALLAKDYYVGGRRLGALGVIGVNRMPYDKLIPTLDYSAQILTRVLSQRAEQASGEMTVPQKM
ncbi:MAG: heat-inducible transcriptional repressor HrcA [Leptospiraceae bacterium]|nr:heat-inducible transcriptional repressor HrcA [Leptospiraceae bacterium]MDW8305995.1 heat-inducible transcriptional repressor HrcA [Leptospiraceae bacterium]